MVKIDYDTLKGKHLKIISGSGSDKFEYIGDFDNATSRWLSLNQEKGYTKLSVPYIKSITILGEASKYKTTVDEKKKKEKQKERKEKRRLSSQSQPTDDEVNALNTSIDDLI
jgi:hypothetical protein